MLKCVKKPYPTHFGHLLLFEQFISSTWWHFLLVYWESGREEGRDLFSSTQKRMYLEVWVSLNKQKDIHSHVEKCVGAMEHGQVMLLGMVFHPCPCDHGVGFVSFLSYLWHHAAVVDHDNGSGHFWHLHNPYSSLSSVLNYIGYSIFYTHKFKLGMNELPTIFAYIRFLCVHFTISSYFVSKEATTIIWCGFFQPTFCENICSSSGSKGEKEKRGWNLSLLPKLVEKLVWVPVIILCFVKFHSQLRIWCLIMPNLAVLAQLYE